MIYSVEFIAPKKKKNANKREAKQQGKYTKLKRMHVKPRKY